MIRIALALMMLAAPAFAQTQHPVPRPDGLGLNRASAVAVAEPVVAEEAVDAEEPVVAGELGRAAIAEQITAAIRNCWNIADLSEEAAAVRIWLAFDTTPEGQVVRNTIEMIEFSNGTQDAADEALGPAFRAIMRCGEQGLDLPAETYSIWQRVEVQFDASSVVTR